jgi:hypothetical protein
MKLLCAVLLAGSIALCQQTAPPGSSTQAVYAAQAQSCQRKFDQIRQNATSGKVAPKKTSFSQGEINAWLASGNADLPKGVRKLQFSGEPGVIHATASVDFDEVTEEKRSSNPLLYLFRGTHEVQATAHASGSAGKGKVHIDSVSLDGVSVPRVALEYFVEKYVSAKHPGIGLDSEFSLPYRIDSANVGDRELVVTQK